MEQVPPRESINGQEYSELVTRFSRGPQIEGLPQETAELALQDSRTEYIEEEGRRLPISVPAEYAPWLNGNFFKQRSMALQDMTYCPLPQAFLEESQNINLTAEDIPPEGLIIDYPENTEPFYLARNLPVSVDHLLTKDGSPAATFHYETTFYPLADASELPKDDPIKKLTPEEIDSSFDELWKIYSQQFQQLVDDHPINGMLLKDELAEALSSEGTKVYVYFDDNQRIGSFGYFTNNFDSCPWLNPEHYSNEGGAPLLYMPGIATGSHVENGAHAATKIMQHLLQDNLNEYGEWTMTFECSNLSSTYVPKIVEKAVLSSGLARMDELKEFKYFYEVIKPQP